MLVLKNFFILLIINFICFKCCMLDNVTNSLSKFEHKLLPLHNENAVCQFIFGFSAPFSDFQFDSTMSGVVFKTKYFLPKQVNNLHKQVFRRAIGKSFPSKIYKVRTTLDMFRWNVYEMLAVWADKFNLDGHMCVLKSLCEIAQEKVAPQSGDVWHDIVHILFTPQTSIDQLVYEFQKDFMGVH